MTSPDDSPPSRRGFFRSWGRLYGAVLLTAVVIYLLLFLFSAAFRP